MKNKYTYFSVMQGNYGDGWEDECRHEEHSEALVDLRAHRIIAPEYSYRIINRRVLND